MIDRLAVVSQAYKWLGTPYHHQARLLGVGVDCAMLLCEVYERAGLIPHIDPSPYPPDWHMHRSEEKFLGWIEQFGIPTDSPQAGDVILFQYGRVVSHGAIVLNYPQIIHAVRASGKVIISDVEVERDLSDRRKSAWTFKEFSA